MKACVLAYIERTGAIFDDRKFSERCWTHDIKILVNVAGLDIELGTARAGNADLNLNWETAAEWNESARYRRMTEIDARKLYQAVTDLKNGVLPWIKTRW